MFCLDAAFILGSFGQENIICVIYLKIDFIIPTQNTDALKINREFHKYCISYFYQRIMSYNLLLDEQLYRRRLSFIFKKSVKKLKKQD